MSSSSSEESEGLGFDAEELNSSLLAAREEAAGVAAPGREAEALRRVASQWTSRALIEKDPSSSAATRRKREVEDDEEDVEPRRWGNHALPEHTEGKTIYLAGIGGGREALVSQQSSCSKFW